MEEATTFGLDATRREQEEETPIRGPRTVATESPSPLSVQAMDQEPAALQDLMSRLDRIGLLFSISWPNTFASCSKQTRTDLSLKSHPTSVMLLYGLQDSAGYLTRKRDDPPGTQCLRPSLFCRPS